MIRKPILVILSLGYVMFSISHVGYDCPIPSCLSNFSPISYHPIPFFFYSIWVFHYLNFFYFLFSVFFVVCFCLFCTKDRYSSTSFIFPVYRSLTFLPSHSLLFLLFLSLHSFRFFHFLFQFFSPFL